ncbi:hypothetical protein D3C81_1267190 [compost metagenome]
MPVVATEPIGAQPLRGRRHADRVQVVIEDDVRQALPVQQRLVDRAPLILQRTHALQAGAHELMQFAEELLVRIGDLLVAFMHADAQHRVQPVITPERHVDEFAPARRRVLRTQPLPRLCIAGSDLRQRVPMDARVLLQIRRGHVQAAQRPGIAAGCFAEEMQAALRLVAAGDVVHQRARMAGQALVDQVHAGTPQRMHVQRPDHVHPGLHRAGVRVQRDVMFSSQHGVACPQAKSTATNVAANPACPVTVGRRPGRSGLNPSSTRSKVQATRAQSYLRQRLLTLAGPGAYVRAWKHTAQV